MTQIISLGALIVVLVLTTYFYISHQAEAPTISESIEVVTWPEYNL